jgi:Zn-dependent protease/CBS domain-containing protein
VDGSINLGSIRGIRIAINYTWLIVFALVAGTLALFFFPEVIPGRSAILYWVLGVVASALLFASVLGHELSHSLVAQYQGLKVKSITLFIFGGVSEITEEPKRPRDEALLAAAGPLASIGFGIIFYGLWLLVGNNFPEIGAALAYLFVINILLAVFNLIPGFPLDGGRVFRSLVWGITGDFTRATKIAARVGQVVAYLFIFGGLYIAFTGNILSGLWFAFIGWFLNNAAEQSYREATRPKLIGVKVDQMMNPNPLVVQPDVDLQTLVDHYVLEKNVRALPVVVNDELVGVVTLSDVRHIPRELWSQTRVEQVMTRAEELKTIQPADDLDAAVRQLASEDINQLPVVEQHHLVGLLSRSQVIRFLQLRDELGMGR